MPASDYTEPTLGNRYFRATVFPGEFALDYRAEVELFAFLDNRDPGAGDLLTDEYDDNPKRHPDNHHAKAKAAAIKAIVINKARTAHTISCGPP